MFRQVGFFSFLFFLKLACGYFFSFPVSASTVVGSLNLQTRQERGADESLRYGRGATVTTSFNQEGDQTDSTAPLNNQEKNIVRTRFLQEQFPQYIMPTRIETHEGSNRLRWPLQYTPKTGIILHHTADGFVYEYPQQTYQYIRDIYHSHARQRNRGDIGYNYLIDPFGNTFEGRAGGPTVAGAHTAWNNATTIGVSLMGNYHLRQPSQAMWSALVNLLTYLSVTYEINPGDRHTYFEATDQYPFIEVLNNYALIGHRDAGDTVCPGQYVYAELPSLRMEIIQRLQRLDSHGIEELQLENFVRRVEPFILSGDTGVLRFDRLNNHAVSCKSFTASQAISSCHLLGEKILITIPYVGAGSSGRLSLGIQQGPAVQFLDVAIVWEQEFTESFLQDHNAQVSSALKQDQAVPLSALWHHMQSPISVLLYQPTATLNTWEFSCTGTCTVLAGERFVHNPSHIRVAKAGDQRLQIIIDDELIWAQSFGISTLGGEIILENFTRAEHGTALNRFQGSITITSSKRQDLQGILHEGFIVVNTLALDEYLHGVSEWSEHYTDQTLELLAILARQFALLYRSGAIRHPAIPQGVGYHSIDHPELFQGYVGIGQKDYAQRRGRAVEASRGKYVLLEDNAVRLMPLLRYKSGLSRGTTLGLRDVDYWLHQGVLAQRVLDRFMPGVTIVSGYLF